MKYFVLFKKLSPEQKQNDYSIVDKETLNTIPINSILQTKEIPDLNPDQLTKEICKSLVEELGGTFYGD